MNITILRLILALLLLVVPAYAFWRFDRHMLRQSATVLARVTTVLLILAVCFYYLFQWNSPWMNILWVLLSGGVSAAVYCRKRWLYIPIYISMVVCTLVVGLFLLLLVTDHLSVFTSHLFIPVMTVLQADALFVCRRGLAHYVLNRRQHASLDEYLRGNGASEMEIQQPFVAQSIKRAFVPVLSQLLLVGLVFVPSLLAGLLVGHVSPLQATAFLAALTAGAMCSSMLSLLLAIYIYFRLKK